MVEDRGTMRRRGCRSGTAVLLLSVSLLAPHPATAFYKQEGSLKTSDGRSREEQNLLYFTDLPVTTHDGLRKRFYSDILKGKVVLISFFYTNCPTAAQDNAKIAEIRGLVEGGKGKDVLFVSISADPERDTPEALKEYAERYRPGTGRVLLTGTREDLRAINLKLGNASPSPEAHIRIFLLGNVKTGRWIRMNEFAPSASVAEGIQLLSEE